MNTRWTTRLTLFTAAATVLLTGCATIRDSHARDTEQLLAAAGFTMQPDAGQRQPDGTPSYRLVSREQNGAVEYVYVDPTSCKCRYVGGPKEYAEYQRLAGLRQAQLERVWAAEAAWPRWDYTGAWWPW